MLPPGSIAPHITTYLPRREVSRRGPRPRLSDLPKPQGKSVTKLGRKLNQQEGALHLTGLV